MQDKLEELRYLVWSLDRPNPTIPRVRWATQEDANYYSENRRHVVGDRGGIKWNLILTNT